MKSILKAGVMVALTSGLPVAHAGIPTADIPAVAQRLVGYMTQLQEYSESMMQTVTSEMQFVQMLTDYEQTLTEYESYLNQMRGVGDFISNTDWDEALIEVSMREGTNSPFDIFEIDIYSDAGWMDVDNRVRGIYEGTRRITQMQNDIDTFGGSEALSDSTLQTYRKSQLATAQMQDIERMRNDLESKTDARMDLEAYREMAATQEETDLATLQYMAGQNIAVIDNLQQIQKQLMTQFIYQNQMESEVFGNLAAAKDREIQRLRAAVTAAPYVPVDSGQSASF